MICADLLHVIDDEAQFTEINIFISIYVHQLDDIFNLLTWKSETQRAQRHVQVVHMHCFGLVDVEELKNLQKFLDIPLCVRQITARPGERGLLHVFNPPHFQHVRGGPPTWSRSEVYFRPMSSLHSN